ncbi:MAG: ABC transporter ATP-binding protein [Rikenellaceae bacterium]
MIQVKNITKSYGTVEVLRGVSLEVNRGEILSITGASGAGKSTLLHIMATLLEADSGSISINGQSVDGLSDSEISQFRNENIGVVFQFHNLLPEFSAIENVMMPSLIGGKNDKEARLRAMELLEIMGLSHRASHLPSQMSGGEQQRVAIARALMNRPSVIFADEPSGNLDSKNREEIHQLFFKLRDMFNQTFVIVTHDEKLAELSDRHIIITDGEIV